jgi:hypothetical protein
VIKNGDEGGLIGREPLTDSVKAAPMQQAYSADWTG